jgi:hypothetical protein
MAGWAGVAIVAAATLLGVIATVLLKKEPGSMLGIFILAGTVIAAFAVRYNAAYGLVPVPALAYVIGAMVPGYIHDRSDITGHLELAAHAAEWVGFGFLSMVAGTIVALVLAIGRYLWGRRATLTGRGRGGAPPPSDRPAGRPAGRAAADGRYRETARSGRSGNAPAFTPTTAYSGPAGSSASSGRPRPAPPASAAGRAAGDPSLGGDTRRAPRPGSAAGSGSGSGSGAAKDADPYSRYYDDGESWR